MFKKIGVVFTRQFWAENWPVFTAIVILIIFWDLIVRIFNIQWYIIPPPLMVVDSLWNGLVINPIERGDFFYQGAYWIHMSYTLVEIIIGWILCSIIGLIIAIILYKSRLIERAVLPIINASQALPKIAIAPLFMVWFGIGVESKIALVTFSGFFPVMLNALQGFRSVEPERIELMKSLGASELKIYRSVIFPSALPVIFTGLEIALLISFMAAVASEFIAAEKGLGLLVVVKQQTLDMSGLFAIVAIMGVLGWGADTIFQRVRDKVCFWSGGEESR